MNPGNPTTAKTSETSPIRVDFVAGHTLGLTFAPGKKASSLMAPVVWDRDLEADLERLQGHYGVDCLVTLLEEHEFELLRIPALRERVRAHHITSHWFPIPDGGVPRDVGSFMATVRTIVSALRTGERVVVHCRGGLGRAGTVAACVLVALSDDPEDAIRAVREARPGAIENPQQENFVTEFLQRWTRVAPRNNPEP